jgi:8-oxo-dGTP diphosphatase
LEISVKLTAADAVAAILQLPDGRFVLQHRDEKPEIWYPGYWGCFGGAVDAGETPLDALHRELWEELKLAPGRIDSFVSFDFDLACLGLRSYFRRYYFVSVSEAEFRSLQLGEGQAIGAFSSPELNTRIHLVPYDAFALDLFISRDRIGTV